MKYRKGHLYITDTLRYVSKVTVIFCISGSIYVFHVLFPDYTGENGYIVEDEKCVDSCHSSGMKNVITVGSSNDFKYKGKRFAPFFKGTDIGTLQDNDKSGEKLSREIISSLEEAENFIKVIIPDQSREKPI